MEITPKFELIEGSFDTKDSKMLCVVSDKYGEIALSIQPQSCGWNFPIAQIKLYSSCLRKDFDATKEDALKLGKEIARRWNNCSDKE